MKLDNHTFIVAEMSANHCQDYAKAEAIVYAAKEADADAVKLQTYTSDTMTIDSDRPEFQIKGTPWDGDTLYGLYERAHMPWEWQPRLKSLADDIGIELFSTPFDRTAVDFLEKMGVKRYKIASFELVDLPLIKYVASTKKPLILSTGMASLVEIKEAVRVARDNGATDITLLKCVSAYPAPMEDMNLSAIPHLKLQFAYWMKKDTKMSVGLSDHTLLNAVAVASVAFGAKMVEKHLTLSRDDESPDSAFSLEPDEFKTMVDDIRIVEKALGDRIIGATESEKNSLMFRRSLFVVQDMKAGDEFTEHNVRSIRPGYGLLPKCLDDILGKKVNCDIQRGTPLDWDLVV